MLMFRDIEDVDAWLAPLDWPGFWSEIGPWGLSLPDEPGCRAQIAAGEVDEETVLICLKSMARIELTRILRLERRALEPCWPLH